MSSAAESTQGSNTPDGFVKCRHGLDAVRFTSHTQKNPNREFYKCPYNKAKGDSRDCEFFCWGDQALRINSAPVTSPSLSQPPQSDPTPQSTFSQSTPTKFTNTGGMTTSQPPIPAVPRRVVSSSTRSTPRPFQPQADTVTGLLPSQTPSTAPHDIESDDEIIILSAPANPKRSPPSTPRGSGTPKRRRIDDNSSALLTPPPSGQSKPRHPFFASPPETPTRSNGNHTELVMPPASQISTDFASSQLVPLAESMHILSPMSASTQEGDTAVAKKPTEPTSESIAALAAEIANAALYVRKLERRKITADKSMKAKEQRIAELEEENLQLKKQIERWQRALKDLKDLDVGI